MAVAHNANQGAEPCASFTIMSDHLHTNAREKTGYSYKTGWVQGNARIFESLLVTEATTRRRPEVAIPTNWLRQDCTELRPSQPDPLQTPYSTNKDAFTVAMYLIGQQRGTKLGWRILLQALPSALVPQASEDNIWHIRCQ